MSRNSNVMKRPHWLTRSYAEFYFLASILFYWLSSTLVNPIAWALLTIMILQILYKKPKTGIILSCFLGFVSFFLLLALLSEYKEFKQGSNNEGLKMLIIGCTWLLSNLLMSAIMLVKYTRRLNPLPLKRFK